MDKNKTIVLGSGELFVTEFAGAIPENSVIETDENKLGQIQGGATLEYKPEFYTAEDDLGFVKKTIITKEDVTLKSGVITWNASTFGKLSATARITESTGKRIAKIGGVGNQDGKNYLIRFLHKDKVDGNLRVTIVGRNQNGFSLAFAKDKETVVDAEFKALPCDNDGTLVILEEDIMPQLTVTSAAGSASGKTKITVTPALSAGNTYKYKSGAGITAPALDESCTTGYTAWDGTSEITATTGHILVMVEVDASNKAKKAGTVAVTSKL